MTRRLVALVWLAFAILWGAWIRVDTALADPNFDAHDARGMLRSDPALLFYLTEEIEAGFAAGRLTPPDFRADPRIQHPFVTDVPAEFPVGQEFLVALARFLLGPDSATPLHVVALVVMSFVAALFLVGVFALVRALTESDLWASLAVLLALLTPANYRTIGFLLVGEDLSLPLFLVHLAWLARASQTGRGRDYLASGVLAAGALTTWHAASFVVTLELGALGLGALVTGRSPLAARSAWLVFVPPAAAGLVVPVLRASGLLLSPAAALALALLVPGLVQRRRALSPARTRTLLVAALLGALLVLGSFAPSSYAHVPEVVLAKLRFLGRFPDDPEAIPFDARLLWQGPFETLAPADILRWSGWPLALLFGAGLSLRWRTARGFEAVLFALALVALPVAWMFARLSVLIGLLAPTCAALAFARWERRGLALALFGVLCLAQAVLFTGFVRAHRIEWYPPGPARVELTALVEFVRANVPPDEPIAGDFVNSTALLAHTRHPIVLQPKYETDRSRRQAEAFLTTFFLRSTAELEALLRERFRCRHLLVDRHVLWERSRVTAGLRADEREPRPGTAAEAFLSGSDEVLASIPGFELIYRSPSGIPGADYRLFRLR